MWWCRVFLVTKINNIFTTLEVFLCTYFTTIFFHFFLSVHNCVCPRYHDQWKNGDQRLRVSRVGGCDRMVIYGIEHCLDSGHGTVQNSCHQGNISPGCIFFLYIFNTSVKYIMEQLKLLCIYLQCDEICFWWTFKMGFFEYFTFISCLFFHSE